jgi:tetratricopeptide (TPR) repeat protein
MDRHDYKDKTVNRLRYLKYWLVIVCGIATANVEGALRHGEQAVTVTDTPRGTVNIRTIPVQRSGGEWGMGVRLGNARDGQLFKFLEKRDFGNQGVWVRIEQEDGSDAWVSGRYLTQTIARDRLIVRPNSVNVRNRASRNSDKIGTVRKGDVLGRVRKQDNWYLAELSDGKRGWVRDDMVKLEALAPAEKPKVEAKPPEPPPEPEKPKVDYRDVAQQAMDAGKLDEAIDAYRKALLEEPNDGILHFELAKLLVKVEKPTEAIPHLRKAINGRPARPEAEFTLKKLLEARQAGASSVGVPAEEDEEPIDDLEEGSPIFQMIADNAIYILPLGAFGSLAFIGILVVLYRKRGIRTSQPSFRRRKADGGFDDVLKYAVEKRPVIREIEEAEKKLSEMDEALTKRFASFEETDEAGRPRLPPGESAERLLKRVDGLRKTILNQEERARIYSDLVVLQNEKITALDDEIEALKKLIQLDYQGGGKQTKQAPAKKPAVRPPSPEAKDG